MVWKDVASPLKEEGLGIKRIREWNQAAIAKYLWKLVQSDPTSSWAKWARANLLRGRSLWDISTPSDCSWTWRKLLSLRDRFRSHARWVVGNGRNTLLWFDNWLPIGPIINAMGEHILFEIGLTRYATVADIIRNGHWRWPWTASEDLCTIKQVIFGQSPPRSNEADAVIWVPDKVGKFSIKSAWDCFRYHKELVGILWCGTWVEYPKLRFVYG